MLTRRERFWQTMTLGRPDRPASGDYFYYTSTRERWEAEGLPAGVDFKEFFGLDFDHMAWKFPSPEILSVIPDFGRTVLEDTPVYTVTQEPSGEVIKVLKNTPPPAMPQWLRYPLESRADWRKYKRRLDPDSPGRLPDNVQQVADSYRQRDYPLGLWVGGTYGYLRNWWGVENVSMLFYDEPALIEEMIECLTQFVLRLLARVLATGVELDWVMFWEDMAYKTGPLLAPALFEQYCLPFYRSVMDKVRAAGIPVAMVDSDGNIEQLIPLWLDVGVNIMHPMEVAAGMDVIKIRKQYGKQVGFFGGIDKRALAGTRPQIRAEVVPKLEYCFQDGGFIPACDHAIPPDVSYDNYCYYRELVAEVAQRVCG